MARDEGEGWEPRREGESAGTQPAGPATQPAGPATQPAGPGTQPASPATQPAGRGTQAVEVHDPVGLIHGRAAERTVRAGVIAWSVIGILLLVFILARYVLAPISIIFPPLVVGLIIVYLLNPLVSALERRRFPRGLGVGIVYLGFLAVGTAIVLLVVPVISEEVGEFVEDAPDLLEEFADRVNTFSADRGWDFEIDLSAQAIADWFQRNREGIIAAIGGVRGVAAGIFAVVLAIVVGMVLSVYLLIDLPKIQRALVGALPPDRRDEYVGLARRVGDAVGGFFRGQLLVAAFVGTASAIGLSLVGLPFGILIGLIAGLFNLIPMIGPLIGAVLAAAVALVSGNPWLALWSVLILLAIQQADNHLVTPRIAHRAMRLHPATVLVAILAGGAVAGIPGMLLVIPAVAAAKAIIGYLRGDPAAGPEGEPQARASSPPIRGSSAGR